MIENKIKTKESESIIRFLAKDEHYGNKYTANYLSKSLKNISYQKVSEILSMFAIKHQSIIGYEQISQIGYFWIAVDREPFKKWFKDWFGKEF